MRILLALPWLLAAACSTPSLDLTPRLAMLEPDGSFGFNDTTGQQVQQDLQDNLGLVEDSSSLGLRADLDVGSPHMTASVQSSSHDGSATLSGEIEYDGQVIDAGADVATDFALTGYSFITTWDLIPGDSFELGLGLGANLLDIQMEVQSKDDPSQSVGFDELAPVPVVAVRAGGDIGPVSLSALASGLSVSIGDLDATYFDLDLMAKWRLLGEKGGFAGSLAAGWRHTKLDAELDDEADQVDLDLAFSGPWFGATIGF
ncbi:MAG: hypothetical protein ACK57N_08825 [Planctomycetia bacterium]